VPQLPLKTLVRKGLGFVHFRSMIRLLFRGLWFRRDRVFFLFEGRAFTYGETYREAARYAAYFLLRRQMLAEAGALGPDDRLTVGIYQENTPEYIFAALGAGLSNSVLFAFNTGFRGDTLEAVVRQANPALLLTLERHLPDLEPILPRLPHLAPERDVLLLDPAPVNGRFSRLEDRMAGTERAPGPAAAPRRVPVDNMSPVLVIYTSGTTGMPKGVPCTHIKLVGAGIVVRRTVGLARRDRGYVAMPLFHSNAWYIGILPMMIAGGSFVLKRKFSASAFEQDMLAHGVTFLNYVGQPLHYILSALEAKYGGPEQAEAALARHPRNRFRKAYGNGAPPVDRRKLKRCLGMEHIYEIYGSTEAVITTANKPGDPADSVGRAPASVLILDEQGRPCPPGVADENGRLINYERAVGEICRKVPRENLRFEGYIGGGDASRSKFRDGVYHSGDLGHVRVARGRRYLYFNGRTDDWIRKDGENFSAESVVEVALRLPGVKLAIAYGAPCEVSDEKVMVALEMLPGAAFDPQAAFDWYRREQEAGGMDPKWMPDYIRIVGSFSLTDTQKILIRPFKREHFDLERHPAMTVYFTQRGDTAYRRLTPSDFDRIREGFRATGREGLLRPGQ